MRAKEVDDFVGLLYRAERQAASQWEMDFVTDMDDRYEEYGEEMLVSDAQEDKLRQIAGGWR